MICSELASAHSSCEPSGNFLEGIVENQESYKDHASNCLLSHDGDVENRMLHVSVPNLEDVSFDCRDVN